MVLKKEKKNAVAVRHKNKSGEIMRRRPVDMWTDIDRMFDRFRSDFTDLFWPWSQRDELTTFLPTKAPPMDLADLGDRYEMQVEMPGMPKENINIEVTPNSIEISAEHDESKEDKGKNWLRHECSKISYYRSLELPEEIKSDNVDAELKDGMLTVMLHKVEPKPEYKVRKVKVK
jgi:HSP20 family protein